MTKTADTIDTVPTQNTKKNSLLMILGILAALGGGIGGTWYVMQTQIAEAELKEPKKIPTTFIELDSFTVNLQPEDGNQYLQVGLTIKVQETDVVIAIKDKMPEIRNRALILLSSKKASEISTVAGKKLLSTEITGEIKQVFSSEGFTERQEEIIDVLFTSFVIQ